jgi:phosphoglycolate phosphatase (TIGR01487 family)
MRYLVLASDFDGTLAQNEQVHHATVAALTRLRESGRRLILVTGRVLPELQSLFERLDLCDRVVAENGALLYRPDTGEERLLAEPPPNSLLDELDRLRIRPLLTGRVIVETREPHQDTVRAAIDRLGLKMHVSFNSAAVMMLPAGVNKATGLWAALNELGLAPHHTVGVGDAENDHDLLAGCECAVAVANALPTLKEHADWVTRGDHGAGVVELIERLIADDLATISPNRSRRRVST